MTRECRTGTSAVQYGTAPIHASQAPAGVRSRSTQLQRSTKSPFVVVVSTGVSWIPTHFRGGDVSRSGRESSVFPSVRSERFPHHETAAAKASARRDGRREEEGSEDARSAEDAPSRNHPKLLDEGNSAAIEMLQKRLGKARSSLCSHALKVATVKATSMPPSSPRPCCADQKSIRTKSWSPVRTIPRCVANWRAS